MSNREGCDMGCDVTFSKINLLLLINSFPEEKNNNLFNFLTNFAHSIVLSKKKKIIWTLTGKCTVTLHLMKKM